jgi:hypothetical protein
MNIQFLENTLETGLPCQQQTILVSSGHPVDRDANIMFLLCYDGRMKNKSNKIIKGFLITCCSEKRWDVALDLTCNSHSAVSAN